jgi:P27 family predicted phage terminase small subunit
VIAQIPPIITGSDNGLLERYTVALMSYREALQKIAEEGAVIPGGSDRGPRRNPWLTVQNTAANEMHRCAIALGLTPSARASLGTIARERREEDEIFESPLAQLMRFGAPARQ